MHIELIGLPGAGKSTLARLLVEEGIVHTHARGASLYHSVLFIIFHPRIAWYWIYHVVSECYRTGTWKLLRFKLSLLAHTFAETHSARISTQRTILDEGLAQRVLSIFETKKERADIQHAFSRMIVPDAYIVLGYEPSLRRISKGAQNRSILGDAYLAQWEEVARHNYHQLLAVIKESSISSYTYLRERDTLSEIENYIKEHD